MAHTPCLPRARLGQVRGKWLAIYYCVAVKVVVLKMVVVKVRQWLNKIEAGGGHFFGQVAFMVEKNAQRPYHPFQCLAYVACLG